MSDDLSSPALKKPALDAWAPGLLSRELAARLVEGVLLHGRPFDEAFEAALRMPPFEALEDRDRAFTFALTAATLRHRGALGLVLAAFVERSLPRKAGYAEALLLTGAAQMLVLGTPAHAAIDQAVSLARADGQSRHMAGLVNAVLRRVAEGGGTIFESAEAQAAALPAWLGARWRKNWGDEVTDAMIASLVREPARDLSLKLSEGPERTVLVAALQGTELPGGTVRVPGGGRFEALAGFSEGLMWAQDAASAIPARLFGDVQGLAIADLCAAPGGKTAQLAASGAIVTAVDNVKPRMELLERNMARLGLGVTQVLRDARRVEGTFDGVLLDAPCSATGTIRRHPDLPWIKNENQIARMVALQRDLLDHAAALVRPGGRLVYATCSLEPEEGEAQIAGFLERHPAFVVEAVTADEIAGQAQFLTPSGTLRILPHMNIGEAETLDGFFVARLKNTTPV